MSPKSGLPEKVIVVEDDAVLGLAIEQILIDHGVLEVTLCPTAACTLAKLRSGSYDAIVLDLHLADSDNGWEIAELIDAVGGNATRIVFQTGSPGEIPARIRDLGPVLTKPYDPIELVKALMQKPRAGLPGLLGRLRGK
jgi:CheY-like chemotaxis protein